MMNAFDNIKYALACGYTVGFVIGVVDILVRVIAWSFEYFEFYQNLLISIITLCIIFLGIGVAVEAAKRFGVIKAKDKRLRASYLALSFSTLVFFYTAITVNSFILSDAGLREPISLAADFFLFLVAASIFWLIVNWLQGSKVLDRWSGRLRWIVGNLVFTSVIFILASFLIDIYYLDYMPALTSDADTSGKPNVILISLDTVRADHLSLYGHPVNTTPYLVELGRDSVVFDRGVSASSWTIPSHTSIFTGKYLYNHGVTDRNQYIADDEILLAELLRDDGYVTAGFVSGATMRERYGFGQGFMSYSDRVDFFGDYATINMFSVRRILYALCPRIEYLLFRSDTERSCEDINKDVFKWLDVHKGERFFLFIHYFDAHHPYNRGNEYRGLFTDSKRDPDELFDIIPTSGGYRKWIIPEDIVDWAKDLYDTELYYLDHNLELLFNRLGEMDLLDNSLIIITADHGEEFYEHGGFIHMSTVYEEVTHVPLIIRYPGFPPKRVEKRVSNIDIFSTVLDVVGLPEPDGIDSASLTPLIMGEGVHDKDYVISEVYLRPITVGDAGGETQRAVTSGEDKLISVAPEGILKSGLYELRQDPGEQNNRIYGDTEEEDLLRDILAQTENPNMPVKPRPRLAVPA